MNTKKITKSVTSKVLPTVAGGIGAKFAKNLSGKVTQNEKLKAALPLILGIALLQSSKTEAIGMGMCAVGGADLAGQFLPAIHGIEDMDLSGLFGGQTLNEDLGAYDVGAYDVGDNNTLNGDYDMGDDDMGAGDGENYGNY